MSKLQTVVVVSHESFEAEDLVRLLEKSSAAGVLDRSAPQSCDEILALSPILGPYLLRAIESGTGCGSVDL